MIDQHDDTITKHLHVAATTATRLLERRLAPLGVNTSQFFFILKLHDNPGLLQDQLVRQDTLHQSNVNREIAKLAKLGLVDKQPATTDRRKYTLALTPAGEALYPQIKAALAAQEADLAASLTGTGVTPAALVAALRQLGR
ncbi:MarR family winged helix-turn-helix transcriptional regulator [Lacticaseibacillus nasuensis]|uniref:MarR family winged helix-turn-helix transcriptional regulator n=1 Tax=Lacticaseibacillus nasuensis TaxID=944671 RepID=UPI0022485DDD|nr:MarR family transcriptional regulator [Lacticaseibacillus nasuensis]MCX2455058.1 MarR family transcriptional regulator [Lacticaseibacillus nasuensis]